MNRMKRAAFFTIVMVALAACAKQKTESTNDIESTGSEPKTTEETMQAMTAVIAEAETEKETTTSASDDSSLEYEPITEDDFNSYGITVEAQYVDVSKPDNYDGISMDKFYYKTWYSPEANAAIRLYPEGAFVYDPVLEETGDTLYSWDLIDRSDRGKCPELAIYNLGQDVGPIAYYVSRLTDDYFYCIEQDYVFYRQLEGDELKNYKELMGNQSTSFNMNEIIDPETESNASSGTKSSHQETDDETEDEETISYGDPTLYMTHVSGYDDADDYADDYADEYLDSGDYEDYDDAYEAAYEDFENYEDY